MTHYETFAALQAAMRAEVARRGLDAQSRRALEREAIEGDTLQIVPAQPDRQFGTELRARVRATGEEQILRDAAGRPYRYTPERDGPETRGQAIAAREALRETVRKQTPPAQPARQDARPERQIPDPRDADRYHLTQEIKTEAKAAEVELYAPDGATDKLDLREPDERALELANLARLDKEQTFQLRPVPAARGGFNLALIDVRDNVPDVLTDAAGQPLTYASEAEALRDRPRIFDLGLQQQIEQEQDNERGGRSR